MLRTALALYNVQYFEEQESDSVLQEHPFFSKEIEDAWCWPVTTKVNLYLEVEEGKEL